MPTDKPMQLGMIGLGRMGGNLVRRLMQDGHHCVGYARSRRTIEQLESEGMTGSTDLADLVSKLEQPIAISTSVEDSGVVLSGVIVSVYGIPG